MVTARDGADDNMVAVGFDYWATTGVDENLKPIWKHHVQDIDTRGFGSSTNVIAAAAVRATVDGVTCDSCGAIAELISRTSLTHAFERATRSCVACDESLHGKITRLLRPEEHERRKQQKRQAERERQTAEDDARHWWEERQRATVADTYSSERTPDVEIPSVADVDVEVMALTMLRFSQSTEPLPAVRNWAGDYPLHPARRGSGRLADLVGGARHAYLFRVHPSTSSDAFLWDPGSFTTALKQADGDVGELSEPCLTDRYFPLDVRWHVPYGRDGKDATRRLDEHLCHRLDPAAMTYDRQARLLTLAADTLADEAERFFDHQLTYRKLPALPDNHQPRLRQLIEQALQSCSLGTLYALSWMAVKSAAASAHSNPRAPKANMTTNAVNRFESDVQRAKRDPEFPKSPFSESSYCRLSAFTRTLFHQVLAVDPVSTDLDFAWPDPVPDPVDLSPWVDEGEGPEGMSGTEGNEAPDGGESPPDPPAMVTRSWYVPAETADRLAEVVDRVSRAVPGVARQDVLASLIEAGLDQADQVQEGLLRSQT